MVLDEANRLTEHGVTVTRVRRKFNGEARATDVSSVVSARPNIENGVATPQVENVPYSREHLSLIALLAMVVAGVILSFLVVRPFVAGLTWALAFAVVAHPIHHWISRKVNKPGLAAALAVLLVALLIVLPLAFVFWQVGSEVSANMDKIEQLQNGGWKDKLRGSPKLAAAVDWLEQHLDLPGEARGLSEALQKRASRTVRTVVTGILQLGIALFALFYFFRDRNQVVRTIRSMLPFSARESELFFERVTTMTHSTIYGTLVVSAVQGALGGLMFLLLGIPGAVLWGFVMGLLSIVPVLGAFIVWMPAALLLAAQGSMAKAAILVVWGSVVVGLIDNLLYPMLVGKETRMHTLPVFIAIIGGLVVFGAAGLVLGPVILAATIAMIQILRQRTAHGGSAEQKT